MSEFIERWKHYFFGIGVSLLKIVVEATAKNKVGEDGILRSPRADDHLDLSPVNGSFYIEVMQTLNERLKSKGDWIWLKNCLTNDVLMASEVEQLTKRIAIVFERLGLKPGECIHVLAGNHNYSYLLTFAAWYLGAYSSTGDVALDEDTVAGQMDDLKVVKLIICTPELSAKATKAAEKSNYTYNNETQVVCLGEASGCLNLFELLKNVDANDAQEPVKVNDPENDNLIIFWSSGTTGKPKGICWTHQSMSNWFKFVSANPFPGIILMSTQCFFHVGAFWGVIEAITKRNTFNHMNGPSFTLQKLLEAIRNEKPKALVIGSHHFVQMSEMDFTQTRLHIQDMSSVFYVMPVGTSVPAICFEKLKKMFPNLGIRLNAYGATEAGPVSVGFSDEHMGMLACRVKVKFIDENTGMVCKPEQMGEICIGSPFTMKEYLERPEETKESILEDGFIRTGDLGFYNEKGQFFMVDRIKEIIKYQNNHVSPSEIENILQQHSDVLDCLVFGKKDPTVQELISAVIVLKENAKVTTEDIKDYANARIKIDYKKIRGDIILRDEIPRNSNGKLVRREMRKWAEEQSR